jgi:uncharacterized repeat protein (TIGR03803 family)
MRITGFTHRLVRLAIATVAVAVTATAVSAQQAATYEVVSSFTIAEGRPNGVIQARNGQFYGTTVVPPSTAPFVTRSRGTVFVMDAAGARTTIFTFVESVGSPPVDVGSPTGNLFEGTDGSVYGTTYSLNNRVGPYRLFKISPQGLFTPLALAPNFMRAGVIEARDGRLYGVTGAPAVSNGSVFRVEASGGGLTTLHSFGTDSAYPVGELVEIDDGSLYGATEGGSMVGPPLQVPGTIFQVNPATGAFAIRYEFADDIRPAGRLIQGSDGLLYGTTVNGGDFGLGTVFSFDAAGTLTTLHHFSGDDGANPSAGLMQGSDGRLYGTTRDGGAFGYGTVFVVDTTGALTTLHDFTLSDGANPSSELIEASDGTLYGAAQMGGPDDGGVIFRLRLATSTPDQYFELVSRNSGKCLDVHGASPDAAAAVIQWVCHGGANQQWRLEPADGGAFRIIARHSGQALDVFGALLDDVIPIIQWPAHGGDNQAWTLQPASDGYVSIVARHSGKVLDVEFASPDDGARVIQYTPHGGANQQWLLRGWVVRNFSVAAK